MWDWWEAAARSVDFPGEGMGQGDQLARPTMLQGGRAMGEGELHFGDGGAFSESAAHT